MGHPSIHIEFVAKIESKPSWKIMRQCNGATIRDKSCIELMPLCPRKGCQYSFFFHLKDSSKEVRCSAIYALGCRYSIGCGKTIARSR